MGILRQRWSRGEVTFGAWCTIRDSFATEVLARAGFDWVCVDTQHGFITADCLVPILQALNSTGTPSLVRVPWNRQSDIMRALDAGADGVIVPMVNTAEQAREAARACRYHPEGYRSWGPTRAALLTSSFGPEAANASVICAVMVETQEAVGNLASILEVPGVDAVFVGPNDLALSSGRLPSYRADGPAEQERIDSIAKLADAKGIVAGISCGSAEIAEARREAGYRMLAVGSDWALLQRAATALADEVRTRVPN